VMDRLVVDVLEVEASSELSPYRRRRLITAHAVTGFTARSFPTKSL